MIRSTLFTLLLLLSFQGQGVFATQPTQPTQDITDEIIEADRIIDEAIADTKANVEGLEEFVTSLEELEELDLIDLFLEMISEGEKSHLVSMIESMEEIEDGINDLPPYARARMGEELIDRVRASIADLRRLMQLPERDEEDKEDEEDEEDEDGEEEN